MNEKQKAERIALLKIKIECQEERIDIAKQRIIILEERITTLQQTDSTEADTPESDCKECADYQECVLADCFGKNFNPKAEPPQQDIERCHFTGLSTLKHIDALYVTVEEIRKRVNELSRDK